MTEIIGFLAFLVCLGSGIWYFKGSDKKGARKRYKVVLIGVLTLFIALGMSGCANSTDSNDQSKDNSQSTKVVKKTKYVGKSDYDIAKKENVALIAKEKKLSEQADSLSDQKDKITSDEAAAKQKEQEQQAAAQKQQEQQAQEAQQQAQSQQQTDSSTQRGDMKTSDSGQIVGNVNSHIYHVPGQAGYSMNSSNAVYFNSEQDAINAGYRRAKR